MDKFKQKLLETGFNFRLSDVLLTSVELGIFEYLTRYKSVSDLAKETGYSLRGLDAILGALAGMGILIKKKDKYVLTKQSGKYLLKNSKDSIIDILIHYYELSQSWQNLKKSVTIGAPAKKRKKTKEKYRSFIYGIGKINIDTAKKIAGIIKIKENSVMADIGAGSGIYTYEILKKNRNKNIKAYLMDSKDSIEVAKKVPQKVPGCHFRHFDVMKNKFKNDFFDVILFFNVMHIYSEKENLIILKNIYNMLKDNGKIYIKEFLIKENYKGSLSALLFSVNMLVNTNTGKAYTYNEIKELLLKAGFKKIKKQKIDIFSELIQAEK